MQMTGIAGASCLCRRSSALPMTSLGATDRQIVQGATRDGSDADNRTRFHAERGGKDVQPLVGLASYPEPQKKGAEPFGSAPFSMSDFARPQSKRPEACASIV